MLTSGKDVCTPKARPLLSAHCDEDVPTVWPGLCTIAKPCCVLPDGKLNTQNVALAAAAHQSKAAQAPVKSLAFKGAGNIGSMTVL